MQIITEMILQRTFPQILIEEMKQKDRIILKFTPWKEENWIEKEKKKMEDKKLKEVFLTTKCQILKD